MTIDIVAERIGLWHGVAPFAVTAELSEPAAELTSGEGVWVTDRAGRRYLDARSGLWNVTLGYSCSALAEAISDQLRRLPSGVTARFERPPEVSVAYADGLLDAVGGRFAAVKLYQSGAQAVEGAVLLARYLSRLAGHPQRQVIISLRQSWHGTGVAAGAVTGEEYLHHAAGPVMAGVAHVPPPYCFRCPWGLTRPDCGERCVAAVAEKIDEIGADRVAAVIVEPLLGTNIVDPPRSYLPAVAAVCRDRGVLLVVDEITTGFGRSGALALSLADGVHPDILLLGKGISGGYVPLSAMLVGERVSRQLLTSATRDGFPHGSASDGYPIASAAGMAVLAAFADGTLLAHVQQVSAHLRDGLRRLQERHPCVVDVRGRGLMWGLELATGAAPWPAARMTALSFACEDEGLLVHTGNNVLDLMPPLTITAAECDELCARLDRALAQVASR